MTAFSFPFLCVLYRSFHSLCCLICLFCFFVGFSPIRKSTRFLSCVHTHTTFLLTLARGLVVCACIFFFSIHILLQVCSCLLYIFSLMLENVTHITPSAPFMLSFLTTLYRYNRNVDCFLLKKIIIAGRVEMKGIEKL